MNRKSVTERAKILGMLVEGNSLRATSRLASCSINTVTKLLAEIGEACAWYQDKHLINLRCKHMQVDEIWSFVYAKAKNVKDAKAAPKNAGDCWTWVAIDAETKLVPSWRIGSRDAEVANEFIADLASRMANRIQLTSDGHKAYINAVEQAFGNDVDFGILVKVYGSTDTSTQGRYSPGRIIGATKNAVTGKPDERHVSTSIAERQNLNMRMSMRRFTRLTNGFSKKVENHGHAIALHFMHYNFARVHKTLRVSPAMAAGASDRLWELEDIVEMADDYWTSK